LLQKITGLFNYPLNPEQKLISYYKEKEFEKLPEIMNLIESETNIVLMSESGMPLISDPGYLLVKTLIKNNISFTVIPGPTAVTTGIAYSGFNPNQFMFLGFMPKKDSEIKQLINRLKQISEHMKDISYVFYESPNRIQNTLKMLNEQIPQSQICICRELTKKFEEISRGSPSQLLKREYKGEITLIINNR
jgi:16S rRNA (cytidine1402-2'-O)-methyltransferase